MLKLHDYMVNLWYRIAKLTEKSDKSTIRQVSVVRGPWPLNWSFVLQCAKYFEQLLYVLVRLLLNTEYKLIWIEIWICLKIIQTSVKMFDTCLNRANDLLLHYTPLGLLKSPSKHGLRTQSWARTRNPLSKTIFSSRKRLMKFKLQFKLDQARHRIRQAKLRCIFTNKSKLLA